MSRKILAPHKEQDGYVYLRVLRQSHRAPDGFPPAVDFVVNAHHRDVEHDHGFPYSHARYYDNWPDERVISSRKVEEAVETLEYLRLCAEEGLWAVTDQHGYWLVSGDSPCIERIAFDIPVRINLGAKYGHGKTVREAYHRYKAVCSS